MKLGRQRIPNGDGALAPGSIAGIKIGRPGRAAPPAGSADALAVQRIEAARRCGAWRELDPDDLIEREGGYLVSAESDACYRPYRGDAFSPGGQLVSDQTPLAFIVRDGDVLVLEKLADSWSQIV